MKLALSTIILATLVPGTHAFWEIFLSFFDSAIQSACDAGTDSLGITDLLDCTCESQFDLFTFFTTFSIGGRAQCDLIDNACLIDNFFCGDSSVVFDVVAGGQGIAGDVDACFSIDSGLPSNLLGVIGIPTAYEVCLNAETDGTTLSACSLTLNGNACSSCSICDNGITIEGDCSNLDLAFGILPFEVPGPVFDTCLLTTLTPEEE